MARDEITIYLVPALPTGSSASPVQALEAPITKHQIPNKSQISISKIQNKNVLIIWILIIGIYLVIGFGIWNFQRLRWVQACTKQGLPSFGCC
jgi:hypothetical protein